MPQGIAVELPSTGFLGRASSEHPLAQLWLNARQGRPRDAHLPWQGEALMLTWVDGIVQGCQVGVAEVAFLDACASHRRLEQALAAACHDDPSVDLGNLVALILERKALTLNYF